MAIIGNTSISIPAALYADIRDTIYARSGRPDLIADTAAAIRKATMKLHMADLWKNDLVEVIYQVGTVDSANSSYRFSIDLTDPLKFARYRRISHIKEYNSPLTGRELNFNELDADRLFDGYGAECIDYWYQAGQQVNVRSSISISNLRIGYFSYPDVVPATYSSWIARQFPDAIIEEALSTIFKSIGKDTEYQRLAQAFNDNLAMLRTTQI